MFCPCTHFSGDPFDGDAVNPSASTSVLDPCKLANGVSAGFNRARSLEALNKRVAPTVCQLETGHRVLLTCKHAGVDEHNNQKMDVVSGNVKTFKGLFVESSRLKEGAPVLLLQNLLDGLRNELRAVATVLVGSMSTFNTGRRAPCSFLTPASESLCVRPRSMSSTWKFFFFARGTASSQAWGYDFSERLWLFFVPGLGSSLGDTCSPKVYCWFLCAEKRQALWDTSSLHVHTCFCARNKLSVRGYIFTAG